MAVDRARLRKRIAAALERSRGVVLVRASRRSSRRP
jgi:hypothetical protein